MHTLRHVLLALAALLGFSARAFDAPKPIRLAVVVQWEGRALDATNLEALKGFRNVFGDVNVLHLLSPAYFLKPDVDVAKAGELIRGVMRPTDQLGMAFGGWKSLATKAGVVFRNGPTFWGQSLSTKECATDCGLDVPVNLYPEADLDKLVSTGIDTLEAAGFGRPQGIITEGWVAAPEVLSASARAGMHYDFSAVAPELLVERALRFPLYQWVKGIWPTVTPHSQAFQLSTNGGLLQEVPLSNAAVDYLTAEKMLALFKETVELSRKDPNAELTFPLVIYQESAQTSVPTLAKVLQGIYNYAQTNGVALTSAELPGLDLKGGGTLGSPPTMPLSSHVPGSREMHEPRVH